MGSMRGPSEGRGMFSRLPDDPAYWDGLSSRIADDAVSTLAVYRDESNGWLSILAGYSTALAVGAVAAVVVAFFLLPFGNTNGPRSSPVDAYGLAPTSPLATPLLEADAPPTMASLIGMRTVEVDE